MTDLQILTHLDFIHDKGCGSGGFRIYTSDRWKHYEGRVILTDLDGEYVNPLGPFRKYVKIRATIMTETERIDLRYEKEFWDRCNEETFLTYHMMPFLSKLRDSLHYNINESSSRLSPEFTVRRSKLTTADKEYVDLWLTENVK